MKPTPEQIDAGVAALHREDLTLPSKEFVAKILTAALSASPAGVGVETASDDVFNDEALTKQVADFLLERDQQTSQDERDEGERESSAFFITQMIRRHVRAALKGDEQ